jgi:hypothetical protein
MSSILPLKIWILPSRRNLLSVQKLLYKSKNKILTFCAFFTEVDKA